MPSVFVYSAGQTATNHFTRSIQNGIPLATFKSLLSEDLYLQLASAYQDDLCYLWGDRGGEHGRQYWSQIKPGDLALCYRNKRIVAASNVVATTENEAAGLAAWPDATAEPYKLLFFLTKPVWTDASVASLPQYFGKVYQGLRRLPSSQKILDDFGSLQQFVVDALSVTSSAAPPTSVRNGETSTNTASAHAQLADRSDGGAAEFGETLPAPKAQNPPWSRDELILALDLYFRVDVLTVSPADAEVLELSRQLNRLRRSGNGQSNPLYRNPNGVRMKLSNFLRFDPTYEGKGLSRGGRLEREVWEEFSANRLALAKQAAMIVNAISLLETKDDEPSTSSSEGFEEGGILEVLHRRRERNRKAVEKKKMQVLKTHGCLRCEVCAFDFQKAYGALGKGFAECHHRKPLSEVTQTQTTRLADLAIVCANCHRMLHRKRPWMSVEDLLALWQGGNSD